MKARFCATLLACAALMQPALAVTIDKINVSTVGGHGDLHNPGTYPAYDRFSILGAAYSYELSDGQVRQPGAGWIPYTNGRLANVSVDNGLISYEFDRVNNWARGEGTVFYSVGHLLCNACDPSQEGQWTEGEFVPVTPLVLKAPAGSTTATLNGLVQIKSNHSGGWGSEPDKFVSFSLPEGSIVRYSATYTLTDGSVWDEKAFDRWFSYNMTGAIYLTPVPEPESLALLSMGLGVLLVARRSGRHFQRTE